MIPARNGEIFFDAEKKWLPKRICRDDARTILNAGGDKIKATANLIWEDYLAVFGGCFPPETRESFAARLSRAKPHKRPFLKRYKGETEEERQQRCSQRLLVSVVPPHVHSCLIVL